MSKESSKPAVNYCDKCFITDITDNDTRGYFHHVLKRSELLGQFRLIGDRASAVSGGRICLTQNAYAEKIVLTETYESRSALTNLSLLENKHCSSLF